MRILGPISSSKRPSSLSVVRFGGRLVRRPSPERRTWDWTPFSPWGFCLYNHHHHHHHLLLLLLLLLLNHHHHHHQKKNRIQRRNSRFLTISSLRSEVCPTRTLQWPGCNCVQITCSHWAFITCNMSCCVPRGKKGQLSCQSLTRIYFSFI